MSVNDELLNAMFRTDHFYIALLDVGFCYIRVNNLYAQAFGYEPEYFPGKYKFDIYKSEETKIKFQSVIDTGKPHKEFGFKYFDPNDPERKTLYIDWTLQPIFNENGGIESLLFTGANTTEEVKQNFKSSIFAEFVNQANDAMSIVDLETAHVLSINKKVEEWLPMPPEEFLKLKMMDFSRTITSIEKWRALVEKVRKNGSAVYESPFPTRDGKFMLIENRVFIVTFDSVEYVAIIGRDVTEKRKIEREKELADALIDQSGDALYVIDADTYRFINVNKQAEASLKYSREELLNMTVMDVSELLSTPGKFANFREKYKDTADRIFEDAHITKDGKKFPVEVHSRVVTLESRRYIISVARDITEKKKAEQRIRFSDELFSRMFDSMHYNIALVDKNMDFVRVNRGFANYYNLTPEYFPGKSAFTFAYSEESAAMLIRVLNTGEAINVYGSKYIDPNDPQQRVSHWDITLQPLFGENGEIDGVMFVSIDVTDRVKYNLESNLFAAFVNQSDDGMAIVDIETSRVLNVNKKVEEWAPISPKEFLKPRVIDFSKRVTDIQKWKELVCEIREKGAVSYETPFRTKTGEILIENRCFIFTFDSVEYVAMIAHDITEKKLREEERNLLVALLDNSADAFFVIERGTSRFLNVNKQAEESLGYSREELLNMTVADISEMFGDPVRRAKFIEEFRNKSDFFLEDFHITKDGRKFPVEIHSKTVTLDSKKYVISIVRDITERREAEKEATLFTTLLNNSNDAFYISDAETSHFLMVSQKAVDMLGYSREEFANMTVANISGTYGDLKNLRKSFSHLPVETSVYFEDTHITKEDKRIPVEISGTSVMVEGKVYYISVVRDITERKKIEGALQFVAQRGWTETSANFLNALAEYIGRMFGVDYVFVDKLADEHGIAETVALYAKGGIVPNIRYPLKGTPCENVMAKDLCIYRQNVQALFPDDKLLVDMGVESYAGIPLWDSHGDPIGLIGLMDGKPLREDSSITEVLRLIATRAAAELEHDKMHAALSASESLFRSLAENSPDAILRYDLQCRVTYRNHVWYKFFPHIGEGSIGKTPDELNPINARITKQYREMLQHVMQTGEMGHMEIDFAGAAGDLRNHLLRFVPERNEAGTIVGALTIGSDITEMKKARKDIELFSKLIGKSNDAFFVVDPETAQILNVNERAEEMLGYSYEEFLNMRILAISTKAVSMALWKKMVEVDLAGGKSLVYDSEDIAKDGSRIPVEVAVRKVTAEGKDYIVGTVRDITERKKQEAALLRTRQTLEEAQRIGAIGSWELNLVENRLEWSDEIFRIFEIDKQKFGATYEAFLNAIHPDDRDAVNRAYTTSLANRTHYDIEHRMLMPDGRIKHVHERCETYYDENGKPLRSLGTVQDITKRKESEWKISILASMVENANDGMAVFDPETSKMIAYNKIAEIAFPYTIEELANLKYIDFSRKLDSIKKWHSYVEKSRAGEGYYESEFLTKDGSTIIVEVRSNVFTFDSKEYISVVVKNITERVLHEQESVKYRQQLEQADKLASLGVLAAGIAHEINNPNNFIMLNAPIIRLFCNDLVEIVDSNVPNADEYLVAAVPYNAAKESIPLLCDGIEKGAARIKRIIENMKDYARRNDNVEMVLIDINKVLADTLELATHFIKKRTNNLIVEYCPDIPKIMGDAMALEQVLINLVNNACQSLASMDKGIRISTQCDSVNNQVIIRIADEGCGIPEGDMNKIFDPFFTTKRDIGGTGLGLFISFGIIKRHGGTMEVSSEKGKGTTIAIKLPYIA